MKKFNYFAPAFDDDEWKLGVQDRIESLSKELTKVSSKPWDSKKYCGCEYATKSIINEMSALIHSYKFHHDVIANLSDKIKNSGNAVFYYCNIISIFESSKFQKQLKLYNKTKNKRLAHKIVRDFIKKQFYGMP